VSRSGFVAVAGRPNVGKSTLANAIAGAKVAITSDKPQTTRRAIRAVATAPDEAWQLVLVDRPGVQRPRDALTARMQQRVEQELSDCDGALLVLSAEQGLGPGDRFIAGLLDGAPVPVLIAVNKVDSAPQERVAATLAAAGELGIAQEIFPISARTGRGVPALLAALVERLPEGPLYFPPEMRSDQPERVRIAELVREQVLRRTREEVPHAVEIEVDEIAEQGDLLVVRAFVLVETESQKGILIGAGGRMIKAIGSAARQVLERELATRVHLDLAVRVRSHWRADERFLDRLGIE
jgi:GTP-binding protein Era